MARAYRIIGFLLIIVLGAYGCTKAPISSSSQSVQAAKIQKLEADYQAALAARDDARAQLAVARDHQTQLQHQLKQLQRERDVLQAQLTKRTSERDALQLQYEKFRTTLKELLGHAEQAVSELQLPPVRSLADQQAQKLADQQAQK
ncbi:MAG: hypothetical protein RMJ56_14705 [Gemmataceae bacterium]|nr:hypothetical protein [Gemmata sp.]MDW8198845.1 hypothetical protein [Gemmataceae bacterium]